jgi:hypothetical protein
MFPLITPLSGRRSFLFDDPQAEHLKKLRLLKTKDSGNTGGKTAPCRGYEYL